jgi:murein L,D-transpeptidase YafK
LLVIEGVILSDSAVIFNGEKREIVACFCFITALMRPQILLWIFLVAAGAALPWLIQDHLQGKKAADPQPSESADPEPEEGFSFAGRSVEFLRETFFGSGAGDALPEGLATSEQSRSAAERVMPLLAVALAEKGLEFGNPVFLRIYKEPLEFEVWMQPKPEDEFVLFKTYKICRSSGELGPKLKEGDGQAPEGFYFVGPRQMNPRSNYHLAFDLGFPNAYDRHHQRTGSHLMVHGNCVSIGCFAMTDEGIEEIYTLAETALRKGQRFFRVHVFPFRMSDERMDRETEAGAKWLDFWANLKEGYDYFEMVRRPPNVTVKDGKYWFGE